MPLFNFKNAPVVFNITPDFCQLLILSLNFKTYGFRAFAVSAPELWNKLPDDIRSCDNLNLFKRKLKTHLFKNILISMHSLLIHV